MSKCSNSMRGKKITMIDNEYTKHERINGTVYTMPRAEGFRHGMVNLNIPYAIRSKLKDKDMIVRSGNYALQLFDEDYAMPDIMLIDQKEYLCEERYQRVPCFIAETITEGTKFKDKAIKKDVYAKLGVAEYWVVDPEEKSCEIYYLEDGAYKLKAVFIGENIKESQDACKVRVNLKMYPHIGITYKDIFEDVDV